jgi:hypothetical protein
LPFFGKLYFLLPLLYFTPQVVFFLLTDTRIFSILSFFSYHKNFLVQGSKITGRKQLKMGNFVHNKPLFKDMEMKKHNPPYALICDVCIINCDFL